MNDKIGIKTYESNVEKSSRDALETALFESRLPSGQVISNLGLFLDAKALSRILMMDFLYRQILETEGIVVEFGTRWGQNTTLFQTFRGIYEPFNRHRKIVGFDTFEGFPSIRPEDGNSEMMSEGNLSLTPGYFEFLEKLLATHESLNPLSHVRKAALVRGDASLTVPKYLEENSHTVIALAYFDFDIYQPTYDCLEAIAERLTKGSVVAFDEVNDPDSPGETLALMDAIGLRNIRLKRHPHASRVSYFVVE